MSDHCCQISYDSIFDQERAQKELDNYLQKGVKKSSRPLVAALQKLPVQDRSVLDIGGGIGTIIFELFNRGIQKATHVDISAAYTTIFKKEAKRRSLTDQITSYHGDFATLEGQIPQADIVTLDKVLCCYEDYKTLVSSSLAKAKKWYVYTIPRDVWWVRLAHKSEQWLSKIRKNKFPAFVHSPQQIEKMVVAAGFQKKEERLQREWLIVVFERPEA